MKVLLIEPVLPHYRQDVFNMLSGCDKFEMVYLAGRNYQGIKSIQPQNTILSDHIRFTLFNHTFYFLKKSIRNIKKIKPDLILCTGVDFHLMHTIVLFMLQRMIKGKKFFWWSHATAGRQGKVGYALRRFFYRRSSGILAYNDKGKERLLEMGVKEENIVVVNNSINVEDYGFRNYKIPYNKRSKKFTILYSGRVVASKKIDLLIKALGRLKSKGFDDFICYIIGGGKIDELQQLVFDYNITENIIFTGAVYGKENHQYFLISDLFVIPGAIGLSIVHAMSFGLPVITTDNITEQGPEFELLVSGVTGDTYRDDSIEDLAEKIMHWRELMLRNENKIRQDCIQRISNKEYLPDKQAEKVIDFILHTGLV